ncbi:amidohydrolase family protein [Naumannella sp. ID2617S]|nr:amidohydrolase family protein [Naumannella sp. ID2617S]
MDATPGLHRHLISGQRLSQRVYTMGPDGEGPVKLVLSEHDLPDPAAFTARVAAAHADGRPVAVHCVTLDALVIARQAFETAGIVPGDRVEHAAICDDDTAAWLGSNGIVVSTQPTLLARRGDDYLVRVEPFAQPWLWRYAGLVAAGVVVLPSSDAPHGDPDPWQTVTAAALRRTPSGAVLNPGERVPVSEVLAGFARNPLRPWE